MSTEPLSILTELRTQRGLTLTDMARACGLTGQQSHQMAGRWEHGISTPKPYRRRDFCKWLWDDLRLRNDPPKFAEVWRVLEDEWNWKPLTEAEQQQYLLNESDTADSGVSEPGFGFSLPVLPPPPLPSLPDLTDFVGRQKETATILQQARNGKVVCISGMAGMGKTSLMANVVTHLLERESAKRPIFWHNFHADEGVTALVWALASFLAHHGNSFIWHLLQRTGHSSGHVPPLETIIDTIVFQLQQFNSILCFDDLHHAQGDPLLGRFIDALATTARRGYAQLLATSREHYPSLSGDVHYPLVDLRSDDALAILHKHNLVLVEEQFRVLQQNTHGNVAILLLVITTLSVIEGSIDQLLQQLSAVEDVERYLIQQVYDRLSPHEREVMHAIALLNEYPSSRGAIEALVGQSIQRTLYSLTQKHLLLVSGSHGERRYRLHALLSEFFYDTLTNEGRQRMHGQAAAYFQSQDGELFQAAYHYFHATEYNPSAALIIEHLWHQLNLGFAQPLERLLRQLLEKIEEQELKSDLLIAQGELTTFLRHSEEAQQSFQQALALLPGSQDEANQSTRMVRICRGLGELLEYEDPQAAIDWLQRGIGLADNISSNDVGILLIRLGSAQIVIADYAAAYESTSTGLAQLAPDEEVYRVSGLLNLGSIYFYRADFDQAIEVYQQAAKISKAVQDIFRYSTVLFNLGIAEFERGKWSDAIDYMRQAEPIIESLGSVVRQSEYDLNMGTILVKQREYDQAGPYLQRCLQVAREHKTHSMLPFVLNSLAELSIATEELDEATAFLDEAVRLMENKSISQEQLSESYSRLAEVNLLQTHLDKAQEYSIRALNHARKLDLPIAQGTAHRMLGCTLSQMKKPDKANHAFAESYNLLCHKNQYEAALTLQAWGVHLSQIGQHSLGQKKLEEASQLLTSLGFRKSEP